MRTVLPALSLMILAASCAADPEASPGTDPVTDDGGVLRSDDGTPADSGTDADNGPQFTLSIEAEDPSVMRTAAIVETTPSGASKGSYATSAATAASSTPASLTFPIALTRLARPYAVWVRLYTAANTSLTLTEAGAALTASEVDSGPSWQWEKLGDVTLAPGMHALTVGVPAKDVSVDLALITDDLSLVPSGFGAAGAPERGGPPLVLAKGSMANAVIVVGDDTGSEGTVAAQRLKATLEAAGDAVFPIRTELEAKTLPATTIQLVVGDGPLMKSKGEDSSAYELEEQRVVFVPGDRYVLINGRKVKSKSVLGFAVDEFLDQKLGVRWLWPGALGTHVPHRADVTISRTNIKRRSRLVRRDVRQSRVGSAQVEEWTDRHQLSTDRSNATGGAPFGHAFGDFWTRYHADPYFQQILALDPEGKPANPPNAKEQGRVKLRLGHPRTLEAIVKEYKADGSPLHFGVSPTDGRGFDTSDDSAKLDNPGTSLDKKKVWLGEANLTPRHVRHWNGIIDALDKANAGSGKLVELFVYGYSAYRAAPTAAGDPKLKPGRFHISFVPTWYDADKIVWKGWADQAKGMYLRPNWFWNGASSPYMPLHATGSFVKHAYANKMVGFDIDSLHGHFGTRGAFYYLMVRLMNHPELEVDVVLDEYASAFGAAKGDIKAFLDYFEAYTEAQKAPVSAGSGVGGDASGLYLKALAAARYPNNPLTGHWWAMPLLYTDAVLEKGEAFLDAGLSKIGDKSSAEAKRVTMLKKSLAVYRKQRDLMATVNKLCWEDGTLTEARKAELRTERATREAAFKTSRTALAAEFGDVYLGAAINEKAIDACEAANGEDVW